jgi:hypothetical protein
MSCRAADAASLVGIDLTHVHVYGGYTNATQHGDYPRGHRIGRDQGEDCRRDHPNPYLCDEGAEELRSVVFLSCPKGSGFTGGAEVPTAALNCVLRSGDTVEEKADMLKQLWAMFQDLTGIATDQLVLSPQEIPSSNAMEMGQVTLGNDTTLRRIAAQLADKPFYPLTSTCCAFAEIAACSMRNSPALRHMMRLGR